MKTDRSARSFKSTGKTLDESPWHTLTDAELETVAGGMLGTILDIWHQATDGACRIEPKYLRPDGCFP